MLKADGNTHFKNGGLHFIYLFRSVFINIPDYADAIECYSKAIELYPQSVCSHEIAVCYANRGACHMKMVTSTNQSHEQNHSTMLSCRHCCYGVLSTLCFKSHFPHMQDSHQAVIDDCTQSTYVGGCFFKRRLLV